MTSHRDETVGLIGLGTMGGNMAARLAEAGFSLCGHDIDPACGADVDGLRLLESPGAVAGHAARVICLVDTADQVIEVATAAAEHLGPGDTFACMSTIDLPAIEEAAAIIAASGADYLDAPLSGGGAAARAGTLTAILGGADAAVARCLPIVEAISQRHYHVGGVGKGFAAKMVNNLAFHSVSVAVIEGMVMGTKAGLDPELMFDLLKSATGDSGALRVRVPRFLARDFEGGPLSTAYRELVMETGLARRNGVPVPLGAMAEEIYRMGMAKGLGAEEGAALVKLYEDWAGVRVEARPRKS